MFLSGYVCTRSNRVSTREPWLSMRFLELGLLYIHESLIFSLGSCTGLDDFGLPIAKRGGIMAYIYRSLIIEVNSRGRCCPPGRTATLIGSAAPLSPDSGITLHFT